MNSLFDRNRGSGNSRMAFTGLSAVVFGLMMFVNLPFAQAQDTGTESLEEVFERGRSNFYAENYQNSYEIFTELQKRDPTDTVTRKTHYFMGRSLFELEKYPVEALRHFHRVYSDTPSDNLTDDTLFFTARILRDELDQTSLSIPYLATVAQHFKQQDYAPEARSLLNDLNQSPDESKSFDPDDIPPPKIRLNFQGIGLSDFIRTYSDLTGTNFLISTDVRGSVTLLGQKGIPVYDLFDVFLNVLESRGYTVVKSSGMYEVQQLQEALQSGVGFDGRKTGLVTRFFVLEELPWDDVINAVNVVLPRTKNLVRLRQLNRIMVTASPDKLRQVEQIIATFRRTNASDQSSSIVRYTPKHTALSELGTKLETLLGKHVPSDRFNVLTNKTTGTVTVVLPSTKKERAEKLFKLLDGDADSDLVEDLRIKTFRLDYAKASTIKEKLSALLEVLPGNFMTKNIQIVVDQRQKALIVSTNSKTALALIEKTIQDLDRKSESMPDNVRVFRLKYADVNEVASTLKDLKNVLPGQYPGGDVKFIANQRRRSIIVAAESTKVFPIVRDVVEQIDKKDVQQPMQHHVYQVKNSQAGPLAEKLSSLFESQKKQAGRQLRITSDEQSNSLVVSASPQQWQTVKRMLRRLDKSKKQILVDVYIAEASKDLAHEIGVEWNLESTVSGRNTTVGPEFGLRGERGTRFNQSGAPVNSGSISGDLFGLNAGLFDPGSNSLQALIHALDQDENFNLLSSSHLVANENEKASLSVGEIIPLKTQEQQATSGQSTVVNSFEFEDVGIELSLTPTLGEDTTVTLDLQQQIEEVIGTQGQGLPTRRSRDIKTKVAVPESNTLVLGGIIQAQEDNTYRSVPLLSDIPVLQWFFSSTRETTEQRNLLVFLRPHIIGTTRAIENQTDRLNRQRKNQTNLQERIDHLEEMINAPDSSK